MTNSALINSRFPLWLKKAIADIGLKEAPGTANNPTIINRLSKKDLLLGIAFNADSIPWCAAMMAWWMKECGLTPPLISARAKSWANWGVNLQWKNISPGAVILMTREGGAHVTMYLGHNATHFFGVGANQSDSVNIAAFPLTRVIDLKTNQLVKGAAIRWPKGQPIILGPQYISGLAAARAGGSEA